MQSLGLDIMGNKKYNLYTRLYINGIHQMYYYEIDKLDDTYVLFTDVQNKIVETLFDKLNIGKYITKFVTSVEYLDYAKSIPYKFQSVYDKSNTDPIYYMTHPNYPTIRTSKAFIYNNQFIKFVYDNINCWYYLDKNDDTNHDMNDEIIIIIIFEDGIKFNKIII